MEGHPDPADGPGPGRLYYDALHSVTATSSTVPSHLEELVVMGASAYAALEWASYATNRATVGGPETWRHFLTWGRERLLLFQRALLQVEVRDAEGDLARPAFTSVYAGTEPPGPHALAALADGALVRARQDGGNVYIQRVENPLGAGAPFGSWTLLDQGAPYGVALGHSGAQVLLFYVYTAQDNIILLRESGDGGRTWGASQIVVGAETGVRAVASAFSSGGVPALFFAGANGAVYVSRRLSGAWTAPQRWPHTVTASGVATTYQGDWSVAVVGREGSGHPGLWVSFYGDGGAFPSGQ